MSDLNKGDLFVVVRGSGERTEAAARALAEAETGAAGITLIREVPFAAALHRGYEIGLEAGARWTLCLDADVLLRPGALAALVAEADRAPETLFAFEGLVVDRLLGQVRYAGVHLYRTAALEDALAHGEFSPTAIRPERRVKDQMRARGHGWQVGETIAGLHDYEQAYVDLFRKAFVYAAKFRTELDAYALAFWRRAGQQEPDFRVASWAPAIHDLLDEPVRIDRRRFPDRLDALLTLAGMEEKPPLGPIPAAEVARRIETFTPPPEFVAFQRFSRLYQQGMLGRARAVVDRHGVLGAPVHLSARALSWMVEHLSRLSEPRAHEHVAQRES